MTLGQAVTAVNSGKAATPSPILGYFQPLWALGYAEYLLHIARKGTLPSPYCHLDPQTLGKTPTLPTEDGPVGGRGFTKWPLVSRETLAQWHRLSKGIA